MIHAYCCLAPHLGQNFAPDSISAPQVIQKLPDGDGAGAGGMDVTGVCPALMTTVLATRSPNRCLIGDLAIRIMPIM